MRAECRTVTRHEWVLPSGCHVSAIGNALGDASSAYGDAPAASVSAAGVTVEARGDKIVISWTESTPRGGSDE